jgi:hypothetical protein
VILQNKPDGRMVFVYPDYEVSQRTPIDPLLAAVLPIPFFFLPRQHRRLASAGAAGAMHAAPSSPGRARTSSGTTTSSDRI